MTVEWFDVGSLPGIVIHVRAYRLVFEHAPEHSSTLSSEALDSLFQDVNRLWHVGRIRWRLTSVLTRRIGANVATDLPYVTTRAELRRHLAAISPELPPVVAQRLWRVCLMHRFPIKSGGVYLPERGTVHFSEFNAKGHTSAVVLAHELGHSLGLPHSDGEFNLMNPEVLRLIHRCHASDPDGLAASPPILSREQIQAARNQAASGPFGGGEAV